MLETNIKAVEEDEDLRSIFGEEGLKSFPLAKELKRVKANSAWLQMEIETGDQDGWGYEVNVSHDWVRFIKSVCILYLDHLRQKREKIASRRGVPKSLLQAVDQQLGRFEEKTQMGVFSSATPYPLLLDQLPLVGGEAAPAVSEVIRDLRPRPVVLDTIEVRDPTLRSRCLDLLAQFREDGQYDRLDTVINEATRILEDRLRALAAAPQECIGVDLAKLAFGSSNPRLIVSDIPAEQEAAHLLYRGVFGFVRNSAHHRLLGALQAERVLQVVGMVDYLISLAEAARRNKI